jgi:hypothetical protein
MTKVTDNDVIVLGSVSRPHLTRPSCIGERCVDCGADATHKIEEVLGFEPHIHPWTAYLCCTCFGRVMGPVVRKWCKNAPRPGKAALAIDCRSLRREYFT